MVKEVNLKGYWPEVVSKIKDFQEIASIENLEFQEVWSQVDLVWSNQYIQDSTTFGIQNWEKKLGIVCRGSETLSDRKFNIINRMNEKLPYTEKSLRQRLSILCGENGYTLHIDFEKHVLYMRVEVTAKKQFEVVSKLLESIVPLNFEIDLSLKYNQHSDLSQFTNNHIKTYTHKNLREEVIL